MLLKNFQCFQSQDITQKIIINLSFVPTQPSIPIYLFSFRFIEIFPEQMLL